MPVEGRKGEAENWFGCDGTIGENSAFDNSKERPVNSCQSTRNTQCDRQDNQGEDKTVRAGMYEDPRRNDTAYESETKPTHDVGDTQRACLTHGKTAQGLHVVQCDSQHANLGTSVDTPVGLGPVDQGGTHLGDSGDLRQQADVPWMGSGSNQGSPAPVGGRETRMMTGCHEPTGRVEGCRDVEVVTTGYMTRYRAEVNMTA